MTVSWRVLLERSVGPGFGPLTFSMTLNTLDYR